MVSAGGTLSVVIVNYRREDLLADALDALRASERPPDELVIVDVDPAEHLALELEVDERLLVLDDNPGYAAACNRGAARTTGEWVLFMNADVTVGAGTIGAVLDEAAADKAVGIGTPKLATPDGAMDLACHRGIPSVIDSLSYKLRLDRLAPGSHRLGHYHLTWLDPAGTHDVEACSGAFLLIRREALEAVGGWDEAYWFYAEDLDLCLRVAQAGWRVRYVGSASAVHVKGGSSHLRRPPSELSAEQRATRDRVRRASIDAHERFYREHLEQDTSRLLRPLVGRMFAAQRRLARRSV